MTIRPGREIAARCDAQDGRDVAVYVDALATLVDRHEREEGRPGGRPKGVLARHCGGEALRPSLAAAWALRSESGA